MSLNEKIEYEYKCFFLDQMRTSRENIFAHSREIEYKKKLKEALGEFSGGLDGATKEFLCAHDNLLESAFRFLCDEGKEVSLDALKGWLAFLKG